MGGKVASNNPYNWLQSSLSNLSYTSRLIGL